MINRARKISCLQISKYYPPFAGGIETTVKDISEGLNSRNISVQILCANTEFKNIHYESPISISRLASWSEIAKTPITPSLIVRLLRKRKSFDIIHVHLPNPMANLALYVSRPKAKIVIHWHSDIVKQKFFLKLYAPLQQWLINRADAILATSPPYAESSPWLQSCMEKVYFTPSCIKNPLDFLSGAELMLRASKIRALYFGKKIVFALGRMTYYKGFDVLVKAARHLDDDVVILLGGEGELLSKLKADAVELGVSDKINFLGRIPDDDLPGYYCAADVFCLPSLMRSEAFGLVMVEAMSYGKPVVATRIPGSGVAWVNIHGETGLNTEPGDEVDLSNALRKLLSDPPLAKALGEAGRRRFESNFTINKMIDSILAVYRKVGVFLT